MEPTRELIDDIYRERILVARRTPPGEKLMDGFRLFEHACRLSMDGIRSQNPGIDENRVRLLLRERIERIRKAEEADIYAPTEVPE